MTIFTMENFGGEVPAIDNRLLADNQASVAENTWLLTGRLEPLHHLIHLHTCKVGTRSVFRLPIAQPGVDYMADSYWLEFENQDVRVIKSPVPNQEDGGRFYWADGVSPKYMTGDQIATTPQPPPMRLGVPLPLTPPVVTTTGGVSATNETRAYTYTWVSAYGEEGPPSYPGIQTGKIDAVWNVVLTAPSAGQIAERNITKTRIYRSVVGAQGTASYFFVAEIPIATLSYDDSATTAQVVLNEQLQSLEWFEPPADLQGLVSMPNGMIAAWRENEIWFCEPYRPHAWPVRYMIAVPDKIVGLGVLGQTLIILTDGSPWSATGIHPSQMALAIIQPLEPCTSRLSIVNTPNGVLYCSRNGLINITAAGAANVTRQIILKDQWAKMLNLDSVVAAMLSNSYYAYSISSAGVFQEDAFQVDDAFQQESGFGTRPGLFVWFDDPRASVVTLNPEGADVQNLITDIFNGEVMTVRDGSVYLVDLRQDQDQRSYRWRSKMFKSTYLENLGAAKCYWTPPVGTAVDGNTVFRMYAGADSPQTEDGLKLRFEQKLAKSGQIFRLPSGYKALYWQFEIEGVAMVDALHVATTSRQLRQV